MSVSFYLHLGNYKAKIAKRKIFAGESSLNLLKEEKGKGLTLKNLRTLLHIYLWNSADMLKSVQALCQSTILHLCSSIDSDAESDKDEMFPAINK